MGFIRGLCLILLSGSLLSLPLCETVSSKQRSTHLAQQEELVSTFLGVFITGALHLLQVDTVQLELLLSSGVTG